MGKIIKLRKYARKPAIRLGVVLLILFGLGLIGVAAVRLYPGAGERPPPSSGEISCHGPYPLDGDTFDCAGKRIRLASIDAPEMPGHCRPGRDCTAGDPYAARNYLHRLMRGQVRCQPLAIDAYGRTVATCQADGRNLGSAMVTAGHAVERYGTLRC